MAWLIPAAALLLALWLGYRAWAARGLSIAIQLDNGHGLKAGDSVRYRGIVVGTIDSIALAPDLGDVIVHARLTSQSEQLARAGSRFWVVRPQLQLTRVEGLETLIGPRFLAVLPADSSSSSRWQREFIGLSEPPIVESPVEGDLEIILEASQRGSLRAGAPLTYRQTRVGTILSVGLAADGGAVEARAHVQKPYVQLIRPQTRFWDVGGVEAAIGWEGVSIQVESAEALLVGGVALATPPLEQQGGEVVRTGHRFELAREPREEWLAWQPMVAIGSPMLPAGIAPPSPLRATIGWTQGRWITREKSRHGWVLQTDQGLLAPADLLKPSDQADPQSPVLEVNGEIVSLAAPPKWERRGLALREATVVSYAWPLGESKPPDQPLDCLLIGDPAASPLPLAASRLSVQHESASSHWLVDPAVPLDESWHGSCVVARDSGRLVGLLLVDDYGAAVALLE